MDPILIFLIFLTFIIHLVGTLAYSIRISGTRAGTIAVSFALFNIMILGSRTANTFQGPLLAKRIEQSLTHGFLQGAATDFRLLLIAATGATLLGILVTPTFQRLFTGAVDKFKDYRSISRMLLKGVTPKGLAYIGSSITIPSKENLSFYKNHDHIPFRYILYNTIATAAWSTGVLSALYAAYLNPDVRVTSSQLSSIINGVATIILIVFIDPYFSILTDDAAGKRIEQGYFRRSIIWLGASRLAGTLLAQLILIPAAMLIVIVSEKI